MKKRIILSIGALLLLLSVVTIKAQEIPVRQRFNPGEEVQYELYFK